MEQLHRLVEPETVLVVDDDAPENLMLLTHAVSDQYRVRAARDGAGALRIAAAEARQGRALGDRAP
jgi:CheY-like chemotaxis protein